MDEKNIRQSLSEEEAAAAAGGSWSDMKTYLKNQVKATYSRATSETDHTCSRCGGSIPANTLCYTDGKKGIADFVHVDCFNAW